MPSKITKHPVASLIAAKIKPMRSSGPASEHGPHDGFALRPVRRFPPANWPNVELWRELLSRGGLDPDWDLAWVGPEWVLPASVPGLPDMPAVIPEDYMGYKLKAKANEKEVLRRRNAASEVAWEIEYRAENQGKSLSQRMNEAGLIEQQQQRDQTLRWPFQSIEAQRAEWMRTGKNPDLETVSVDDPEFISFPKYWRLKKAEGIDATIEEWDAINKARWSSTAN